MKAIVVMFDTLSRRYLSAYGNDWVQTPNFRRLAERAVTFDTSYVCSMPCMPARREFHTGRPNFLHRSWGPLEPFDDSMPHILSEGGVHTHLATDHNHYFEDGGLNYHTPYTTWEFFRGQEGDPWIGQLKDPDVPASVFSKNGIFTDQKIFADYKRAFPEESSKSFDRLRYLVRQDWVNRQFMSTAELQSQGRTFNAGLEFVRRNARHDNWMLQIETFDPHEPFFAHQEFRDLYEDHFRDYDGPFFDWPFYAKNGEFPAAVEHLKFQYAALISMCDAYLGKVLNAMDEFGLWEDTMLVVWTDHGFLMGEHDWWGKCSMPMYQEVAHTPFFVWDPRSGVKGERRSSLIQPSIDLAPTLLRYFGQEPTPDMLGHDLARVIANDTPVRSHAIFGMHGSHVNITDGRYVYMRAPANPDNAPLYQYTLMPTHMRNFFAVEDFADLTTAEPFAFTKGARTMKINNAAWITRDHQFSNFLWDTRTDSSQSAPLPSSVIEKDLTLRMAELMAQCDAPPEQYERLGL